MLDVHGQPRAISHLQRALRSGRLAHTWIFAGSHGVGKYRLALELAKTAMCDAPRVEPNGGRVAGLADDFPLRLPCNACESCHGIAMGSHPDLHVITKELIRYHDKSGKSKGTTLGIDVIRGEITGDTDSGKEAKIYKRSFRGRGKWFLIDEADLMEVPAQNALLKTLEEPPAESFLVLITTSPQELLSTIRSRSQIVSFQELPDEIVVGALEGRGVPGPDAELLARLSHGSLGRALRWAEDIKTIAEKNAQAAERKAKQAAKAGAEDEGEEGPATVFTAGGILGWTRQLSEALDGLVAGTTVPSQVAAVMAANAEQFARLALLRDPLASKDQANRSGLALMLAISADWFADRLRQGLGVPRSVMLPGRTAGLDPTAVREIVSSAREAEGQLDMNANNNLLLAAVTTRWERLLRAGA